MFLSRQSHRSTLFRANRSTVSTTSTMAKIKSSSSSTTRRIYALFVVVFFLFHLIDLELELYLKASSQLLLMHSTTVSRDAPHLHAQQQTTRDLANVETVPVRPLVSFSATRRKRKVASTDVAEPAPQVPQHQQQQEQPPPPKEPHHPPEPLQEHERPVHLHILFYETSLPIKETHAHQVLLAQLDGLTTSSKSSRIKATIFGAGKAFDGFGAKQAALLPLLQAMIDSSSKEDKSGDHENDIVVVSDGRDILLNIPKNDGSANHNDASNFADAVVDNFVERYQALVAQQTDAIVVSAEAQCCVNSMTTHAPGTFVHADGSRNERACSIMDGWDKCGRHDDPNDKDKPYYTQQWKEFMQQRAHDAATSSVSSSNPKDIYANVGLIAGTARNILRVLEAAHIHSTEDDQAVLTDYWYQQPQSMVLDYNQDLFGNNRHAASGGIVTPESCVFDIESPSESSSSPSLRGGTASFSSSPVLSALQQRQLKHGTTHTRPLFLHSSNRFWSCQEAMAQRLGVSLPQKEKEQPQQQTPQQDHDNESSSSSSDDGNTNGNDSQSQPLVVEEAAPESTESTTVSSDHDKSSDTSTTTTPTTTTDNSGDGDSQDSSSSNNKAEATDSSSSTPSSASSKLRILFYETNDATSSESDSKSSQSHASVLVQQLNGIPNVEASIFGQGTPFEGFGSKFKAVRSVLQTMVDDANTDSSNDIVVISDSRDVLMNVPSIEGGSNDALATREAAVQDFVRRFHKLTASAKHQDVVVLSAEAQCCLTSMYKYEPGDFYHANGTRHHRACMHGEPECQWAGKDPLWLDWMRQTADAIAKVHYPSYTPYYEDIFLNAGVMAGTARNLLQLMERAQIDPTEDDQAALTGYWYRNPDAIVLDYEQSIFGTTRHSMGAKDMSGCVFDLVNADKDSASSDETTGLPSSQRQRLLHHTKLSTTPLFVHNPGKFWNCHHDLARKLGLTSTTAEPTSAPVTAEPTPAPVATAVTVTEPMSTPKDKTPLHILFYETQEDPNSHAQRILMQQLEGVPNVKASIFGQGTQFEGFGSKFKVLHPILQALVDEDAKKDPSDETIVVLSDARDVLMNLPMKPGDSGASATLADPAMATAAVEDFRQRFYSLTANTTNSDSNNDVGVVVVSAEAQCCVTSMSRQAPSDYYHADGSRNHRACMHTEPSCWWAGDHMIVPWKTFMEERALAALQRDTLTMEGLPAKYDDAYLNNGLIAGTARNLMRLVERVQMGSDEDDQALLTGYWYWNPDAIVLDYGQTLFGNTRHAGVKDAAGCVFDVASAPSRDDQAHETRLVHTQTHTTPLFLHNPGKFFDCHDSLARKLGLSEPYH